MLTPALAAGCIPAPVEEHPRGREEGCTQALVVECTLVQVEAYIPDPVEVSILGQAAVYPRDQEVVSILGQVVA